MKYFLYTIYFLFLPLILPLAAIGLILFLVFDKDDIDPDVFDKIEI